MTQDIQTIETQFMEGIKKNAGTAITMGIILLIMGIFSMGSPLIAGISIAMMVGGLLVVGGIGQLVFAFKTGLGFFAIIMGVLTVFMGGYMLSNPGVALASLTIFLAAYLIVSGISESIASFKARPANGWAWALFSGILSVILGVMIWGQFPLSGAWAIGILIGVRLLFSGMSLLMLGLAARSATK
ncbi:MAG: HdeD family acid-resistance protein [Gammaproteobacteria bacterium]|nr:MAG: HdeD family acid-resistance protein [Gammaproteobacteria bacterium]